ncbi:PucR family transcriptional regulator [Paenibacillus cellulositrophicus]|uniref:PucR family transcriptional regulator n=1 Tax=Paenibacillus cellulositrophicus TaxID=562959 RepID=UPI001266F034|nr:PucR family transcriptional regulator [Paenibacillus cellulositrophicus]
MSPKGLTVREMLKLPVMEHAQLISGERGLDRIVQYIDIWEVPDIGNWLREGEMVLTTGYSTRNDPSLLVEMIEQLAKVNGAGVAIKPERFIPHIPQEMIDKSNQYDIPIIQLPVGMAYIDITYHVMDQILNRQAVLLRRAEEVNKALTRLVLNNKGIQVVADNVSELIDSPIWIIGKAGEVLASSPEGYPYRSSGKHHQWEVSVDNKMLGKFVVEKRELNELDLMLIEQARLVFSLELMRNKIAKDTENRLRGTFFEELILNTVSDERVTASRGRQLGLSPEWLWEVAVVEADEPFYNEDSSVVTNIQAFIRKESAARKVRSQLQIHGGRIVLFLPSAKPAGQDRRIVDKDVTLPWCAALSGQLSSWEGVRMGIGRPGSLVEAHRSYGEARTAVSIGYRLNQERRMFTYTEVEMIHLLQESTDPARLNQFVEEKVGVLAEHDRTHGTNYVRTLYHYMATGGSLNETSLRMFIHRNSVNYRMDRIKSILDLDLNNPRCRFELYLCTTFYLLNH